MPYWATLKARPSGLYCATKVPWLQHKLSLHIARENFVGSFHWVLFIGPHLWPCLYLKRLQEVLIRTELFSCEEIIWPKGRVFLHGQGQLWTAWRVKICLGSNRCCTNAGCPATEGTYDLLGICIPPPIKTVILLLSYLFLYLPYQDLVIQSCTECLSPHCSHHPVLNSYSWRRSQIFHWFVFYCQDRVCQGYVLKNFPR